MTLSANCYTNVVMRRCRFAYCYRVRIMGHLRVYMKYGTILTQLNRPTKDRGEN